jgi:hypothetical protein
LSLDFITHQRFVYVLGWSRSVAGGAALAR